MAFDTIVRGIAREGLGGWRVQDVLGSIVVFREGYRGYFKVYP
jgi:hypothetical protein